MAKKLHYYMPHLKEYARKNRNNPTTGEKYFWNIVKRNQLGVDFHRQKPIGPYIYDFYSPELQLVVEIDGESHDLDDVKINDKMKDAYAKSERLDILRFTDQEVISNGNKVEMILKEYIINKKKFPLYERG